MNNEYLLRESEGKLLLKYILPSVGGMLGLSLCILFDTLFIGRKLGSLGIGALNITLPIYSLMSALGLTLGVGGATVLSIYIGKKKFKHINKIFTTAMVGIGILYVFFIIIRIFFMNDLVWGLGASTQTFAMVKSYLNILIIFSGAYMLLNALNVFVRNDANPKLVMLAVISTNIVNIILDYVFMYPLNMGIAGAALATSVGQFAGLIVLTAHFIKKKNTFSFDIKCFDIRFMKRIIRTGVPSFISGITAGIVIMIFNMVSFKLLGNLGVCAYGVVNNIALIFVAVFNGVAQGIQPLISINYGAKKDERVKIFIRKGRIIMFCIGLVFLFIGFVAPEQMINFFTQTTPELMKLSKEGIYIYFISFVLAGINLLNIGAMQSIEQVRISTVLSVLRGFVYILICLIIFSSIMGMTGVWITIPLVEILTLITFIIYEKVKKTHKRNDMNVCS
ncbi:MAG: MATE family efflux transporter [Sarcina sp.]